MPKKKLAGNVWEIFKVGSDLDNTMLRLSQVAREFGSMADVVEIDENGDFYVVPYIDGCV